jgi:hypothetical protein
MVGEDPQRMLSELAKLGARLIIQRAVEEEFDAWLGRSRYERRPDEPPGKRNSFRPRRLQTGEGELRVEIPQVREAAEPFVSKLFPKWLHGGSSRLDGFVRNSPRSRRDRTRREGPPPTKFYELRDNLLRVVSERPPGRLLAARARPATDRKQRGAALGTVALPTRPTVGEGYLVRVGDGDLLAADATTLRSGIPCR